MAYIKQLEAKYRRKRVKDDLLNKPVKSAEQVYQLFRDMQDETKEKIVCLHLNPRLEILSYEVVSIGTSHHVLVDIAGLYRGVLLSGASRIIVVHNHPLGSSTPSQEDKDVIKKIIKGGEPYSITLEDFIIIGEDGFFSFDQKNLLRKKHYYP